MNWGINPRYPFYGAIFLLAAAVFLFERYYLQSGGQVLSVVQGVVDANSADLTSIQQKQLDAFLNMNSLVISLGTGLLGALFFLISQSKRRHTMRQLIPAFLSAFWVALSLYFGYQAYNDLLVVLGTVPFDITNPVLTWDRMAHFYTFVFGVILFADFAFYELTKEKKVEPKATTAAAA